MAFTAYKTPPAPDHGLTTDEWNIGEWEDIYGFVAEAINDSGGQVVILFTDQSGATLGYILEELFRGYTPAAAIQAVAEAFQRLYD